MMELKKNEIIGWTAIFGGIFGIIISFIFEKNQIHSIQNASLTHLSYIFYSGLIGALLPHLIFHHLIKVYGVCKTSIFNLPIPFITAIGGILFFKEKINIFIIAGGLLLITGIYIVQYSESSNDISNNIDSNL